MEQSLSIVRPGILPGLGDRQAVVVVFALAAIVLFAGLAVAVPGPYSLDEAIYILMVDAARAGRLSIENGEALFASDALHLRFLRDGPSGLVPQYPSGYAFLALPFYLVAGVRGLIFLNILAHLGAMAVTYRLARQLAASRATAVSAGLIFGFATFASSYAYGIWPHALSSLFVLGPISLILTAVDLTRPTQALVLAAGAGLLVGIGCLIRVDTVLIAPPILLWLATRRDDWSKAFAVVCGTGPGLAMAVWMNHAKFGSWLPVSYGGGGGNTVLVAYLPLAAAMAVLGVVVLLRAGGRLGSLSPRPIILLLVMASLAAFLAVAPLRALAIAMLSGLHVLVFDFQAYAPAGWESALFSRSADGHLLLLGQVKRSLIESLPFLGTLPLLLIGKDLRRPLGLLILSVSFWLAPFALRSWHGGSVVNMRYLLPILPLLSVMTMLALSRLADRAELGRRRLVTLVTIAASIAGLAAVAALTAVFRGEAYGLAAMTDGARVLGVATIVTCGLAAVLQRPLAARMGLTFGVVGLTWAAVSATVYDLGVSQAFRHVNFKANEQAAAIPAESLVITGRPFRFMPQLLSRNSFVASPGNGFRADGAGLVRTHIQLGHDVYVEAVVAHRVLPFLDAMEFRSVPLFFGDLHLLKIVPATRTTR